MMLNTRIDDQRLSTLCERVGVAFEVGLDPYRVFERESESRRYSYAKKMKAVAAEVRRGNALSDAIRSQGNYFPKYFADMIAGGEAAGRLDRVLDRSANYYAQTAEFRASFRNSILWPLLQLVLAVFIVAGLIYIPDVISPGSDDPRRDMLGLGLIGWSGVKTYAFWVALACAAIGIVAWLIRNGYLTFIIDWVARLPLIGRSMAVFPESRFVQTFALGIDAGLNAIEASNLAFRAAGSPAYVNSAEPVAKAMRNGNAIHEAFQTTGLFQRDTLEVIELGESSGRLAELLDKHYRLLKIQVQSSMAKLTYLASAVIWAAVTILLICVIIRIFMMYLNNFGPGEAVGLPTL
ncbi:MAG: type II secretion system F family protein [Pirellulaceae bacterium]